MILFSHYLSEKNVSTGLWTVLTDLAISFKEIADALDAGNEGYAGSENVSGDRQVKLDVLSNDLLVDRLKGESSVSFIGSEEMEKPYESSNKNGYSVVFDPLDGSSLVDTNLAVGTIVGIYEGSGVVGRKGSEQVASLIAVYGPRLTFMITLGDGVDEFIYDSKEDAFVLYHENLKIGAEKKMFAPGNLGACATDSWYMKLLEYWVKNGYKLRYSGGMVPDVNQILKKGGGVFCYPGSSAVPEGKLRLLYECAPIAYLIEQAGGKATDGTVRILDIPVKELHQRTPVFVGSSKEVEKAEGYLAAQAV
jgi:fructose-1,6-bisphosphatase I